MRIRLAFPMSLGEIAAATNGQVAPPYSDKILSFITTDSREVFSGDLFIALEGENHNGERFVHEVISKGAYHFSKHPPSFGVHVHDTRDGILKLAKHYKTKFKSLKHTVAITGSVGKTTTKEFVKTILSEKYAVHATYKNLNNTLGVPLTVLSMPKETEILVVEMGMNSLGEISKSSICTSPTISIILNVGTSHIGRLGSRESIAKAKLEVLDGMNKGTLLIPYGEPLLNILSASTFDRKNENADFRLVKGEQLSVYVKNKLFTTASFNFTDRHLLDCLIAAASVCYQTGLTSAELKAGISKITSENIRQKIIATEDFFFLSDFYNSSPESVEAALDSLNALTSYRRKSVLLGDILELGDMSEKIHFELGKTVAKYNFYNLYLFGKYSKNIFYGAKEANFPSERLFLNEDTSRPDVTASQIKENHIKGEIILLKASRRIKLERILDFFQKS